MVVVSLDAMREEFEEVTVFGSPALLSPARIDSHTVPRGYHKYELRGDKINPEMPKQIAHIAGSNHWGTLIMRDKLLIPAEGFLPIEHGDFVFGTGSYKKMWEFRNTYPPVAYKPRVQEL